MGLASLVTCSSADAPPDGGALVDAGIDVSVVGTATDGGSCDDCGFPRFTGECAAAEMACVTDPGCASIRNCIFSGINGSTPCALDATGPACVETCIMQTCTSDASVSLYHALDQCAYCTTCNGVCSAYCAAFPDAGLACPHH
jgi:hypothetical protein